jgi:hypothetical protein
MAASCTVIIASGVQPPHTLHIHIHTPPKDVEHHDEEDEEEDDDDRNKEEEEEEKDVEEETLMIRE